ncbi:bypass of stop codon protein 1 [Drosophila serrata]|uniref:bypass of stop codon protein 1 n=1 Tax=Drosophila serrata TaxID=7274 RepID=UPI000A1CFF70|nr:bypass of stop codon protein 1 [Drosophila serrata]
MKASTVLFVLSAALFVAHVWGADTTTSTESSDPTTTTTESTTTESTTDTTSSSSSSGTGRIVRISNLKYSVTRRIKIGSTTASTSTRSRSARARKARLAKAKKARAGKAVRKAIKRNLSKKARNNGNVRVYRG